MDEKKEIHHVQHHEHITHHSAKKIYNYHIFIGISVVLGLILIFSIYQTFSINSTIKDKAAKAAEIAKPAKIELSIIKDSRCKDCFDASQLVTFIKTAKVEVISEKNVDFDSAGGKVLLAKYNLDKVPTVVVTGEIDKINLKGFEKKDSALVFTQVPAPYVNTTSGETIGRISLVTVSDIACAKCGDITKLINQMKASGIKIVEQKNISSSSDEGTALISKYNLDFVPTIILSKDADAYPIVNQAWIQLGTKEADGSYVLRTVYPPYINLTTGKLSGIVDIVYLTDKSCAECYNVSVHNQILTSPQTFAVKFDKQATVDISDAAGKELLAKYNITKVPTVILSNEVSVYPGSQALKQFFSIEKDGSYVFRQPSVVGAYMDLTTNQVIKPQQQTQGQR